MAVPNSEVWRVVFNDGENHNALVFKEPVEGKDYHADQVYVLRNSGGSYATPNDEGNIPHREPSGDDGENLGVTWHMAK